MITSAEYRLYAVIRQQLRHDRPEAMHGWTDADRGFEFARLVLEHKPKVIVEIGVFGGRSLLPMALALQHLGQGMAYGIDPWRRTADTASNEQLANRKWWAALDLDAIHTQCMREIWKLQLNPYVCILRTESQYVAHLFPSIDFLNIDGAHSEEASCRDVNLYLHRVPPGGLVHMDDCDWPSTQMAVKKIEQSCRLEKDYGSSKLFRKL